MFKIFIDILIYLRYLLYHYFIYFYCCSITVVPVSPLSSPMPYLPQSTPPSCPCSCVIYTCSLTRPFHFFPPFPPHLLSSGHCHPVPCFHASGPILLVCLFYQVPLIGEIIWYFSFTAWLISLSIIFSSAIHDCKGQEFLPSAVWYSIV